MCVPLGTNITKHKMVAGPTVVDFSYFSVSVVSKQRIRSTIPNLDEINTIRADAKAPSDDPQHITSQALFAQGGQYLRALHKQTHTHKQAKI